MNGKQSAPPSNHHFDSQWPRAHPAQLTGKIKTCPDDFQVTELSAFSPSGHGEHLWLWVEKQQANTEWAARQLARVCGVAARQVGYAGLKDRQAITRQWFSVQLPRQTTISAINTDLPVEIRVLKAAWHNKKLRRGYVQGNRFVVTLRHVHGQQAAVDAVLADIRQHGFPNYFGVQRFGHDFGNLHRAMAAFTARRLPRSAHQRGLLLSAARAYLFNTALAVRLQQGQWNLPLEGDIAQLDGSRSHFVVTAESIASGEAARRLADGDIHLTGPLWGRGPSPAHGAAAQWESCALKNLDEWKNGLERAGLKQERRALRCLPKNMQWTWRQGAHDRQLVLRFDLPAGSYATELLAELGGC